MEFNEKLQQLRKQKNLTQEQLAEQLFVSRTAVSKWESGKGYPNIESLKNISKFFSVSIDELLSSDEVLIIAETENKTNLNKIYSFIFGVIDIMAVLFILLPLYGEKREGYIYSVNLLSFKDTTKFNLVIYWIIFITLIASGIFQLIFIYFEKEKGKNFVTKFSIGIDFFAICFFAMAREPYVNMFLLLLFAFKILIKVKQTKSL